MKKLKGRRADGEVFMVAVNGKVDKRKQKVDVE